MGLRVSTKDFKPHPASDHPPEIQALFHLVDLFANEMKIRLMEKYYKGKRGWDADPLSPEGGLMRNKLKMKAGTGDPVDMANWAMFLWNMRATPYPKMTKKIFDMGRGFDEAGCISKEAFESLTGYQSPEGVWIKVIKGQGAIEFAKQVGGTVYEVKQIWP